jgi:hypothetical protein
MRDDLLEMLFRLAEHAHGEPVLRARLVRAVRVVLRAAIAEKQVGSDRLYRQVRDVAVRWARWRAPRLMRALAIDPTDARDLGRIQDWEDELLGVTGHWVESGARCAVKHETACPFVDLATIEPRICTELVHELETETFRALNPSYRLVPLTRLMSKGAPSCEFRHEVAERPRRPEEMNREHGA